MTGSSVHNRVRPAP